MDFNYEVETLEKYVYKITNDINGKVYIGQTNDLKRRWKEHCNDKRKGHLITLAIRKYGKENFSMEVLYFGEDYNSKEKEFISKFKSRDKKYGYNIAPGGQDSHGELNPRCKISKKIAEQIKDYLLHSDLGRKEIAKKLNIKVRYVDEINRGEAWVDRDKSEYPLRRFAKRLSKEEVDKIINLLKDKTKSIDDIEKETGIKRYTILNINKGSAYKRSDIEYPIKYLTTSPKQLEVIICLLKNTEFEASEIAQIAKVKRDTVYHINYGSSYYDENITYPIRKKCYV